MLANLLSVPRSLSDWSVFSFNNRSEIDRINAAIQAQYGITLPSYPLDPINFSQVETWLEYNAQSHIAFNGVLNLQSVDLLAVDFRDPSQLSAWVFLNYNEMYNAEVKLQI
jgi:hypothetical protein